MRVSGLLEQLQASTRRVTELSARRKATQRKLSDVNLVERNLAVSQRLLSEERAKIAYHLTAPTRELNRTRARSRCPPHSAKCAAGAQGSAKEPNA